MPNAPLLTVDLGTNGGKLVFLSHEELQKWTNEECTRWDWVSQVNHEGQLSGVLSAGQVYARDNLRSWVPSYPHNSGLLANIEGIFTAYYAQGKALTSASAAGRFVLKMSESDPLAAVWALAVLTSQGAYFQMSNNSGSSVDGVVRATLFRHGIKGTSASEKAALDNLYSEMSSILVDVRKQALDAGNEFTSLFEQTRQQQQTFEDQASTTILAAQEAFREEEVKAKESLKAIEKTYDEKLALQAPVEYWTEKQAKHLLAIKWLVGLVVLVMLASVLIVSVEVHGLIGEIKPGSYPQVWKVGLVLISLTMLIWIIRLMVKVLLSQVHLHTDAQERTVLAKTYLSLVRSNQALTNEDRELVLQILFRPAATGIVDDGGPATPMEILSKLASGGK